MGCPNIVFCIFRDVNNLPQYVRPICQINLFIPLFFLSFSLHHCRPVPNPHLLTPAPLSWTPIFDSRPRPQSLARAPWRDTAGSNAASPVRAVEHSGTRTSTLLLALVENSFGSIVWHGRELRRFYAQGPGLRWHLCLRQTRKGRLSVGSGKQALEPGRPPPPSWRHSSTSQRPAPKTEVWTVATSLVECAWRGGSYCATHAIGEDATPPYLMGNGSYFVVKKKRNS